MAVTPVNNYRSIFRLQTNLRNINHIIIKINIIGRYWLYVSIVIDREIFEQDKEIFSVNKFTIFNPSCAADLLFKNNCRECVGMFTVSNMF